MRRTVILFAVCWALALACGVTCAVGNADAGTRGVLEWRHDADELFITSHARQVVTFKCKWRASGWTMRTWGTLDPGQTRAAWTMDPSARGFDCWRT